jgi:hypothetical protein
LNYAYKKYSVTIKMIIKMVFFKIDFINQSLVGSVVIDAELGREKHGSISRNCDRKGVGTT